MTTSISSRHELSQLKRVETHENGSGAHGTVTPVSESSIGEGMQVYSFDGEHVGRVLHVDAGELVIKRSWGRQRRVPVESVLTVDRRQLILTRASKDAPVLSTLASDGADSTIEHIMYHRKRTTTVAGQ